MEITLHDGKFDPNGKPEKVDRFSIGSLSGFEMALEHLREQGFQYFSRGNKVTIECTGLQPSNKGSDMPMFSVSVEM